ncbi:DUF3995 domain-containing protein [Nesterenkonia natronophila]|uniref:DUF3995 domain-containing protein n=1 Tax=Nesterenkonia natronophila TaxID=2174932 RepID=A0A3A4F394_9MICC|nr:DUF3995 domain-containing protein [Nesterenkonia natronophila]RJN32316.1 DUF3995 domain-containing protein [Nesterenkonia natronophila]
MTAAQFARPKWAERRPAGLLWAAGIIGLLNAAPNFYWALGGELLLETIGMWLVELRSDFPLRTGIALLTIALTKTTASLLPLLLLGHSRHRRLWWSAAVVVCLALILYGAVGVALNLALLLFTSVADPTGRIGQAVIWYPMLLLWGLLLALGLRAVMRSTRGRDAA